MAQAGTPTPGRHVFYQYMFEKTSKKPTTQLDALLRGIANYIIEEVGDKHVKTLTPQKLAAFYKAVGGDYDALFVDIPYNSLSYIYASIGCEHTLQPTGDDYAVPTIPALTERGFSRWQSIEILLGPEEHVPFMQRAVKNFGVRNPDNNELFPPILPDEVFPRHPDADIERWHTSCAEKLRREATPNDEDGPPLPPRRPKVNVQAGYTYVPAPRQARNPHHAREYFAPPTRGSQSYRGRPTFPRNSSYHGMRFPESPQSPESGRASRRRSFPDNSSSPNLSMPTPEAAENLKPPGDERNRRHSHPRHQKTPSTSSVSGDDREKRVPKDIPIPREGPGRKRPKSQQAPWIRINIPPGLRSEPNSPNRSNSHSSSNSHAGAAGVWHSRNNSDNDSLRDRDIRRRAHHHNISVDSTGQLSAQFMPGHSSSSRSNSHVRRSPRMDMHPDHPGSRRMSMASDGFNTDTASDKGSGSHHRKRTERSARSQDRGKTDRKRRERMREKEGELREKERQRERGREKERDGGGGGVGGGFLSRSASIGAKLGFKFGRRASIDIRDREEKREREREREDRERGRDRGGSRERRQLRERRERLGSVEGKRYPQDGVVRR